MNAEHAGRQASGVIPANPNYHGQHPRALATQADDLLLSLYEGAVNHNTQIGGFWDLR